MRVTPGGPTRTRLVRATGIAYLLYLLTVTWQLATNLGDDRARTQALLATPFVLVFGGIAIGLIRGSRLAIGLGTWIFGLFAVLSALLVLARLGAYERADEFMRASRLGLEIYGTLWVLLWIGVRGPAPAAEAATRVPLPTALRCFAWMLWLPALSGLVATVLVSIERRALTPLGLGGLSALVLAVLALRYGRALSTPRPLAVTIATVGAGVAALAALAGAATCARRDGTAAAALACACLMGAWISWTSYRFAVRIHTRCPRRQRSTSEPT